MINARTPTVQKQQRATTPVAIKSHSKASFNIEEWENKAPLTRSELKSIADLQIACQERPLPSHLEASENYTSISRSSTPVAVARNVIGTPSRPGTPQFVSQRGRSSTSALYPQAPIDTLQQFYDWYSVIDRSISHSLETQFQSYLFNISEQLNICDGLEERIDDVQKEVDSMIEEWISVEDDGRTLKDACEQLLSERDDILQLMEAISATLLYFQELDHAIRLLNHPGNSLVLQAEFLDTVERIDVCIDFLHQHKHYRECEVYLLRFQQCLSRAMTLIRMFVVNSFKNLSADISKRLLDKDISQTTQTHLLYTRFQTIATQISPLLGELERRTAAHPEDLSALLSECQNAYFGIRRNILVGRLTEEIKNLDPSGTELVELTRAGSSYLRQLCVDEFSLYKRFFSTGKESLYTYLESLCDYLYDDLRPRILHEPRLTVLCDVCMVLQALIVLDMVDDDDVRLSKSRPRNSHDDFGQLRISYLLQTILQDAQTRLVFKAQSVMQSDIKFYVPKSEDLDYPKKLISHITWKSGNSEFQDKKSQRNIFQDIILLGQDTWYPTLSKTVWLLNQLHDFIQPAIFSDIALEAIDVCRASLVAASEKIASKESEIPGLNGLLFLIRHLFILKKMISVLDLVSHTTGHDISYSSVTSTLRDALWSNSFMPPSLATSRNSYAQSTNTSENIDIDLRRACEQVINLCASTITLPFKSLLEKATEAQEKQVTGSKEIILAADDNFRSNLQKILLPMVIQLKLFLEDDGANSIILSHVEDMIVDDYTSFRQASFSAFGAEVASTMFSSNDLRSNLRSIYNNNDVN